MLRFIEQQTDGFGVQFVAITKHRLFVSIVRNHFSYGNKTGLFELGIFVPNKTQMTSRGFTRYTLPHDVTGWLTMEQAVEIAKRFDDYPAQKLSQAYRWFRAASKTKSKTKAKKLQRKANRLLNQLPTIPSIRA